VVSIGLLVVTTPWVALVVVLIGVWGLSWGATPVILQTWMMRAAPRAHEEGLSLFMFVVQLSIAGGSLGGGIVVDALGNLWTFGAGAVVAFGAGVVVLAMLRRASPAEHPFSWRRAGDELFGDSLAAGSAF
jgi:predicted MFS family arabinose efflux permease